jgi:hypothetical protein
MPATTATTAVVAVLPSSAGTDDVITAADLQLPAADQRLGDNTSGGGENPPIGGS